MPSAPHSDAAEGSGSGREKWPSLYLLAALIGGPLSPCSPLRPLAGAPVFSSSSSAASKYISFSRAGRSEISWRPHGEAVHRRRSPRRIARDSAHRHRRPLGERRRNERALAAIQRAVQARKRDDGSRATSFTNDRIYLNRNGASRRPFESSAAETFRLPVFPAIVFTAPRERSSSLLFAPRHVVVAVKKLISLGIINLCACYCSRARTRQKEKSRTAIFIPRVI